MIEGKDLSGETGEFSGDGFWGPLKGPAESPEAHTGDKVGQETVVVYGDFSEIINVEGFGAETTVTVGTLIPLIPIAGLGCVKALADEPVGRTVFVSMIEAMWIRTERGMIHRRSPYR